MRILIVDDDFTNRRVMQTILCDYGVCDVAVNGMEALEVFKMACDEGKYYDLICLDIMMPEMDGHEVLRKIREYEELVEREGEEAVKVVMTSALGDFENIRDAFSEQCEGYLVKPIDIQKVTEMLKKLDLI